MKVVNNQDIYLLKSFQISWSKNKYWVMSRSQQAYNKIRLLAKGNEWSLEKQEAYEKILIDLEKIQPTDQTLRVTYQHVWGYFKKLATIEEKQRYLDMIDQSILLDSQLESFLKELSIKYNQEYLLQMRWLLDDKDKYS